MATEGRDRWIVPAISGCSLQNPGRLAHAKHARRLRSALDGLAQRARWNTSRQIERVPHARQRPLIPRTTNVARIHNKHAVLWHVAMGLLATVRRASRGSRT